MKPNKGTIFFIHGNSSSSEVFKHSVESDLLPYNKIALDLLGHGDNQINNNKETTDFSIKAYKDDILKQLEKIDNNILLVGNSLGGHIAIEIAPYVNNLKGIVIFGTPPVKKPLNFEEAFLPAPALQTFFTEHPNHDEIEVSINTIVNNKKVRKQIIKDFKKANPLVRKAIATDAAEGNFSNEFEFFTKTDLPKYIIAGKQDISINPEYLQKVTSHCKGPCELITFENCGHYPSIEKPQEFTKTLAGITQEVF